MLDKRSLYLLNILNNECSESGYKIFSIEDVALSFPPQFAMDIDGVRECLKNLAVREYVSVKYEDETEFCIKPTLKGRFVFENRIDEQIERTKTVRTYFAYSALGAIFGGVIVTVIAVAIIILVGGKG